MGVSELVHSASISIFSTSEVPELIPVSFSSEGVAGRGLKESLIYYKLGPIGQFNLRIPVPQKFEHLLIPLRNYLWFQ